MDIKDINNVFNDDLADLFNNAEEMEHLSIFKFLVILVLNLSHRLLEGEKDFQKRLNIIQELVKKFLPKISVEDLEEKLLRYLLPALKEFLNSLFDEVCQLLTTINLDQKSVRTLNILQSYLQMCVTTYEMLNYILDCALHNQEIVFCKIYSLPLNIIEMLFITFQHCKQSDKLYKVYFEDLKEIFSMFKGAQDVHIKLLKLLEKHVDYNVLTQEEIDLLKKVLEILSEIGSILVDMNIKALADNWKGFLALTQKLSEQLSRSDFDTVKPMQFLSTEICRNINNILKMEVKDQKGISQILKICNFFIRIILKLCETFWVNLAKICRNILEFLAQIYEYYPPFLRYKGYPEIITREINGTIFDVSNQIIKKLIHEPKFYEELTLMNVKAINTTRYLFLFTTILQNNSLICEEQKCIPCSSYYLIDVFLKVAKESYCEFFWKIQIPTSTNQPPMRSIYNENVINISNIIVSLDQSNYNKVEHILLQNILQDCIWSALLATDIWCLCLSKSSSNNVYETLLQMLVKTRQFLSNNFTIRPEKIFLENLLKRVYLNLPEEFKCTLLEKFPLASNLCVWKCLGLQNFPQTQFYVVESFLINLTEKMEDFKKGECNVDDYNFLCNSLEAISSLSIKNETNLKYLLSTIVRIWDFNVKLNNNLPKNALFEHFIDKLCQATNNFILNFSNQQLLSILLKVRYLLNSNFYNIKIRIGQILLSLSTRSFKLSMELKQITTVLSEIFSVLLQDKNPVIKQNILEVFIDFLNATPHEEIIHNAIKSNIELQNITSNFLQKEVNKSTSVNTDDYFKKQKDYKFEHVCPLGMSKCTQVEENNSRGKRKTEITNKDEIKVIMKRIKSDLELLHKVCGKENLCEENINDVTDILSKRVGFRI
ncbi:hypothetical protein ILUMI_23224 [Ignelater luminosus]|uniref:Uncharacterized protein n=1 Tax=Ignelater luminosus TaxID=2038154 RepID=A0A8K0C973_IGNLU|nr:hypothetical protein ILUMI_23224 [Ignelater luminosus]